MGNNWLLMMAAAARRPNDLQIIASIRFQSIQYSTVNIFLVAHLFFNFSSARGPRATLSHRPACTRPSKLHAIGRELMTVVHADSDAEEARTERETKLNEAFAAKYRISSKR